MINSHELHIDYRGYKDAVNKITIKSKAEGKSLLERRTVEMNNFQNPQVNILYNLVNLYTDDYVKALQPSPSGITF